MRRLTIIATLCSILAVAACGREEGAERTASDSAFPAADTSLGSYHRTLIFLPVQEPDDDAGEGIIALALESDIVPAEAGTARRTAARLLHEDGWREVMDDSSVTAVIRQPWRILPRGPLRLVLGDEGEVEAFLVDADGVPYRLEPGAVLAEWSPGAARRLRVRDGLLIEGGGSLPATVFDLEAASGDPTLPPTLARAVLAGANRPVAAVLLPWEAGGALWISQDGRGETVEGVRAERAAEGGWRLIGSPGSLMGELSGSGRAGDPGEEGGSIAVEGWLLVSGERRPVRGVLAPEGG